MHCHPRTAIRSMMCYFKNCDLTEMINIQWYDNTSVTILDYEDGKFNIVLEGDTSHLEKELCTVQIRNGGRNTIKNTKKELRKRVCKHLLILQRLVL